MLPNEPDQKTDESTQSEQRQSGARPQFRGPQIPFYNVNMVRQPQFPSFESAPRMGFWRLLLKDLLSRAFGIVFSCIVLFVVFVGGIALLTAALSSSGNSSVMLTESTIQGTDNLPNKIVVLPIEGVIATEEEGFIPTAIKAIREDKKVRGLILRVNSPGGTISGSDYYLHLLKKLKKELNIPVVVSMGDVAASGGYYISTVADKIFAERSTVTGSIGVIVQMYNAAELCKKLGVRSNPITSGAMKGMGDFMKEPTPEETAIWQKTVNDSFEQFLSVVREGRPWFRGEEALANSAISSGKVSGIDFVVKEVQENVATVVQNVDALDDEEILEEVATSETAANDVVVEEISVAAPTENVASATETGTSESNPTESPKVDPSLVAEREAQLRTLADGRIYSAAEAKELHLIDEIGYFDDAIDATIALTGLAKDTIQVVRLTKTEGLFDSLVEARMKKEPLSKALDTISAPRAYYLAPRVVPFEE